MDTRTKIIRERYKRMAPAVIEALKKRGFDGYFCETAQEASETVLSLIPEHATVSRGDSVTLNEIGVMEKIRQAGYSVIDILQADSQEELFSLMREALTCDVFLSSVNAMSEDGAMINIDGTGNRIAAIAFGPKSVILVVGMNKICRDAEAARARARTYAAPNNGLRRELKLPCAKTGFCHDCNAPDCMCSQIVEMRRNSIPHRVKVILVGEDLGL
ncbi:lactate utilization protein [Hominifimenecus sp. rT4P-3]|uniref:lactate utilization protein n=1 Tax=Hominifimenecus sp. rT4P-3 TaxID=3242979 RepID=UPI003DA6515C